jgi:hypothetical protein
MKKIFILIGLFFCVFTVFSQNIGVGTSTPQASAALDISSANKGLLPPRVTLTGITDITTVPSPAAGLLVYNTATAGTAPNDVVPGYYYYTGAGWYRINNPGVNPGEMLYWNGSQWATIAPPGASYLTLTYCHGIPTWGTCPPVAPILTTKAASGIGTVTANSGGIISDEGGATISAEGICYNTTGSPTTADITSAAGAPGGDNFSALLSGLNSGTTYHVRAYGTNSAGTGYGNDISFTTNPTPGIVLPTLTTTAASSITRTTANSGGNVTSAGGGTLTARGICYGTSANPTIYNTIVSTSPNGANPFTSSLTGLTPGTTYHIRAYATNEAGTGYGNDISFAALPITLPVLTTTNISSIGISTATSGGNVSDNGGENPSAKGICYSSSNTTPTTDDAVVNVSVSGGGGNNPFTANMSGLTAGTTYYVRAFCTNSAGTAYGNMVAFTTNPPVPFTAATYDFGSVTTTSGLTDPTPVPTVAGITFGSFIANNVGGFVTLTTPDPAAAGNFAFNNWPVGTNLATSTLDLTKYEEVTITPGNLLDLSKITFRFMRTGSNDARQASVRSSLDNYTANLPASISPANGNLSVVLTNVFQISTTILNQDGCTITLGPEFSNMTAPLKFRIYGFNCPAGTGNFGVDNVVFTGVSH